MKVTLSITDGAADWEKTIINPSPKDMDELFCGAYAHIKVITPKAIEIVGEECESCSA